MPIHQLQNLLMQRRLQFQLKSHLPIQPEFIQYAPFNSVFTFYGAPVWHSSFPRVRFQHAVLRISSAREGYRFSDSLARLTHPPAGLYLICTGGREWIL
jgi:hypothetical protein